MPFYFPKMSFYSQNYHFIFLNFPFILQKCPFVSWNYPFVFQKCIIIFQKCLFISQKSPIVFLLLFSFPEVPSLYLLCASFQNAFFPADCTLSWSGLLREICLVLVLFSHGTLYWLSHDAFLITLKPLHGLWVLYVVYLHFNLCVSLENTVSEHLEWLKFQKFCGSFTPKAQ